MVYRLFILMMPVVFAAATAFAGDSRVTPYGEYCIECAVYGSCRDVVPRDEAVRAIDKYYHDRGYEVRGISHKGRFVEADVYKNGRQVDRVLFDRKTGRLRSTY